MPTKIKSCLVVSYGPVPTPESQTIEGTGMRSWGLAKGLANHSIDVTVAINAAFPQSLQEYDGIKLTSWSPNEQFAELLNSFDAVIASYTMGSDSVFIADRIKDDVQLILDAYVPIYVEVAARDSNDTDTEYRNYMGDIVRFNHVLRRGDYFLYANGAQKTFYTGVLSSLGIINPRSYREKRLLSVPFGIHDVPITDARNPYGELGIKKDDFVALWFGGLYPWFRVDELLEAILELSKDPDFKFVIVGGKNPFNPHPDLARQYEATLAFVKKHGLLDKSVFLVDWVDFDDRVNWFANASVVVSLNQPGQENGFSWRTRVMDFVWGELPVLTNGGDPLSEDLIANQAAVRLNELSAVDIVKQLKALQTKPQLLKDLRTQIRKIKPRYYWQNIMRPVAALIEKGDLPYATELAYKHKVDVPVIDPTIAVTDGTAASRFGKMSKAVALPRKVVSHARRKGIRRSAKLALDISKTQARKYAPTKHRRRFVFISHPIDNTGAPLVLLQIVREYAKQYGNGRVVLVTPDIPDNTRRELQRLGVKVEKAALGLGFRFIRLQLALHKNDFVLMNTAAIYDNYRDFVMLWLKTGRLKHAFWFIHEDIAQLPFIHKEFLDSRNIKQTHNLMEQKKLTLLTPSKRTKDEYAKLLGSTHIKPINLHVEVDKKYEHQRKPSDYATLNFLLSGTPSDGRKGQLIAIPAFQEFIKSFYEKNPRAYRNFKLHLVGIGKDYISQQIVWVGDSLLGKHLVTYPPVSKEEALEISSKCNAVICCSLNETFALYVAEGMLMGHVVLRNNSAGMDEQLKDGKNGYFIDHTALKQFAGVIEKLLNKQKTSDADLQKMGQTSQSMMQGYTKQSYLEQIASLRQ